MPVFIHPPRVPIGNEQQMDQFKLDELIGRPFDTAMALARMILSGLFDRYPRLKIVVAHMGGGLLPCMGRLDFGYRLGCDGMPEHSVIRCKQMPSEYLKLLHVDTMGFWAPHVREAVEVFGADRVMFGTDYGPVPIDPEGARRYRQRSRDFARRQGEHPVAQRGEVFRSEGSAVTCHNQKETPAKRGQAREVFTSAQGI